MKTYEQMLWGLLKALGWLAGAIGILIALIGLIGFVAEMSGGGK